MNKLIMLLIVTIISGCASKNTLTGTIYISGNEPFTQLSIKTDADMYYKIECTDSLKNELWQLQGIKVELDIVELNKFEKINIAKISGYKVNNE